MLKLSSYNKERKGACKTDQRHLLNERECAFINTQGAILSLFKRRKINTIIIHRFS